jgi:peptide deformylase
VKVRTLGDPVLKEKARPVTAFDEKLERLASQMAETMEREDGVGLAATQVGILSRVIVWRDPDVDESVYVFVNPVITECSESCTTAAEGCLSLPGASVQVTRPDEVAVRTDDLHGTRLEMRLTGYPARIVQHEIDHLEGCLILDRAAPEERRRVLKEFRERTEVVEQ